MTTNRPSRVLLVVWDGMRPDLISPDLTPNLAALGDNGCVFDANHAVVPTVTRINAATLATGAPSSVHGLPANLFFAPAVDPQAPISVGEGENVAQLRQAYGVFAAPTIADVIRANGGRTAIVSSGTRGCAWMLHPRRAEVGDLIVHPTLSTDEELRPFVERLGPMPDAAVPDTARNRWLARAAAEIVLPELRPDLLIFWHDDPDKSQHQHGFGHPVSLRAIRDADAHLGIVLAGLDAAGLRQETLIVVASDHGYVEVTRRLDVSPVVAALADDARVIVAPNGCSVLFHLRRPDARHLERMATELRKLPGVDVMFSGVRGGPVVDGTLPMSLIQVDGPLAPDLLVTLSWSDDLNDRSYQGVSYGVGSNRASHGGASAWEIRNTLIVQGPGVRSGIRSSPPSGIIDLAPTVLSMLGLTVPESMVGRVLHEALTGEPMNHADPSRMAGDSARVWEQTSPDGTLRWSEYGGRRYLSAVSRAPLLTP
ncbi:MAG TPA: alkaline phosphatase family protein [Chloroflexota bacterium]|nr:alkaline phosphatase family protein [Chloroflexota bacterium]